MKKSNILLVAFFGFNLISCTDEPVDFQQETGELIEVEERNYEGGEIESVSITKFNDQRPQMVTEYDASGEVFSIARLSYNAADLLVSIKMYPQLMVLFFMKRDLPMIMRIELSRQPYQPVMKTIFKLITLPTIQMLP